MQFTGRHVKTVAGPLFLFTGIPAIAAERVVLTGHAQVVFQTITGRTNCGI